MDTDFLQLVLEIMQLPIIILIVIFCHRTSVVLKFTQMKFIAIAFGLNFIYMLLTILDSDITRNYVSKNIYIINLRPLIEIIDLITFSFFPITCYYYFKQNNQIRSENYPFKNIINNLFRNYVPVFLIIGLILACFISFLHNPNGYLYIVISAFFKAISILSLTLFFLSLKSYYAATRYYVLFALIIWLLLQFSPILNEEFVKQNSYIFFLLSAITKILIAVSIFKNPLIMEKIQLQKEKANEFKNILSVALHEINTPLDSLNHLLSSLVKSDETKGQSFIQLDSDYEKLRLIVEDTEEAFRNATEENKLSFSNFRTREKAKSMINLNKITHKCVMIIKDNYKANSLDIKITFGKEIHAYGNESEVHQIILNIMKNAVEAYQAHEPKEIHITTDYDKYKDNNGNKVPIIQIEDFANGISKEDEEKIWQQGFSTKIRANKIIKGQGLHISKELAERNKVEIKFISSKIEPRRKKKGTTFIIKFTPNNY